MSAAEPAPAAPRRRQRRRCPILRGWRKSRAVPYHGVSLRSSIQRHSDAAGREIHTGHPSPLRLEGMPGMGYQLREHSIHRHIAYSFDSPSSAQHGMSYSILPGALHSVHELIDTA